MHFKNQKDDEPKERNIASRIFSIDGEPIMECFLKEIFWMGARIAVAYFPEEIPDSFRLQIYNIRPKCRVTWRKANELGIEFCH